MATGDPAAGDPALTQDKAPAQLAYQDRPERMPQFIGSATSTGANAPATRLGEIEAPRPANRPMTELGGRVNRAPAWQRVMDGTAPRPSQIRPITPAPAPRPAAPAPAPQPPVSQPQPAPIAPAPQPQPQGQMREIVINGVRYLQDSATGMFSIP